MSNVYHLNNVKELLKKAAAKENDSSEEKHITGFLNDCILDEDQYDNEDKLHITVSACHQMIGFCELVIREALKDIEEGQKK
jgi:hypothetical protein